jgi:putative oxidoreductase
VKLLATRAPSATLLVRLVVGFVFVTEGVQKFLFSEQLGAGRFRKIGLPSPEVLAPIVGAFETLCGACVAVGFATRVAVVPLITIMLVALATTKLPILRAQGFFAASHEARTDLAMLFCSVFLLIVGAGPRSFDARLRR